MNNRMKEEHRILRLLVERGFVDEQNAARFGKPSASDESTSDGALGSAEKAGPSVLAQLVQRGLVDKETIEQVRASSFLADSSPQATEPVFPPCSKSPTDEHGLGPELLRWDRYRIERMLGRGGSGEVFLAHDLRLNRPVAVKLLSEFSDRGLREAQLQARVGHHGVCKVYEAGFVGARPFVAMQYVQGETLETAACQMTLEATIAAVRDAALAVHAAHAIGLVHRDMKPGNIMIERQADGADKTYVLDFGLAKEIASDSSTVQGSLLGTPAYMAPEQARGDIRRIDRRTDVYGLGATLYHALAGQPPFAAGRAVTVLHAIVSREAPPLRKHQPTVSPDLEAIVAMCLEKDPGRRYPSALAFANDLDRYLRGEPVQARRLSSLSRLARYARRHRAAVLAVVVGVVALSAIGGGWIRDRAAANERAATVRRLTEDAEAVSSILRLSHLSPLHDTRPERAEVYARLQTIEQQMENAPQLQGLKHAALGRGYLSLGEPEVARKHLDAAFERGERGASVSFALAQTYGELYERGRGEARRIVDPKVRNEQIALLEKEFLAPALAHLVEIKELSATNPELLRGYFAFFEGRHNDAIQHAKNAAQGLPWLYEAKKLEGDVFGKLGQDAENRSDYDAALAAFALAADAYAEAANVGRSDPIVHAAECRVRLWALDLSLAKRHAIFNEAEAAAALAACDRSLAANPDPPEAWEHKARILVERALALSDKGGDPFDDLLEAIQIGEELVVLYPERARSFEVLGLGLFSWCRQEAAKGVHTTERLSRTIDAYEQAALLDPWLVPAHHGLGVSYRELAEETFRHGEDPRPALRRAIEQYEQARELDPTFSRAYNSIGRAYGLWVEYEIRHGISPRESLALGARAYKKAENDLPNTPIVANNAGLLLSLEAFDQQLRGEDSEPSLKAAEEAFDRAIELSGTYALAYKNRGTVHRMRAERDLYGGSDPTENVRRATADYTRATKENPQYAGAYRGLAEVLLLQVQYSASKGRIDAAALARGEGALEHAFSLAPKEGDILIAMARYTLFKAAQSPDKSEAHALLDASEKALRDALSASMATAGTHTFLAETHLRRARLLRGADAIQAIEKGVFSANEALRINPKAASAHVVLGALLELHASLDPHHHEALAGDAHTAFAKAEDLDRLAAWKIQALAR